MRMWNQVHYYEDEAAPTGTCAVCVVGGERSVLPDCAVWVKWINAVYLSFELKFCASVGYFVLAKYIAANWHESCSCFKNFRIVLFITGIIFDGYAALYYWKIITLTINKRN